MPEPSRTGRSGASARIIRSVFGLLFGVMARMWITTAHLSLRPYSEIISLEILPRAIARLDRVWVWTRAGRLEHLEIAAGGRHRGMAHPFEADGM